MRVEAVDIIGELHALRQYAVGLRDSIAQAQAGAPRSTAAADRSGAVRIVLDAGGLPESMRVAADWQRRLDPTAFGDAVVEAFQVAAGERLAAWSRADPTPGQPMEWADPLPVVMPPATVAARPLDALAEDLMRALDGVHDLAAAMPLAVTGTGTSGSGRMVVTLSRAGLVSCAAEPRWVSRQSGQALTAGLNDALAEARADLARALSAGGPTAELDHLVTEALSVLADPLRFISS